MNEQYESYQTSLKEHEDENATLKNFATDLKSRVGSYVPVNKSDKIEQALA